MSPKLQRPAFIYFDGKIRAWDEAVLHISTEAVTRGLNVFEGLKGYWQPDGGFGIVALRRHWERLQCSARLLHIPFDMPFAEFEEACHALVRKLYRRSTNMWVRATLFVVEGHWGEGTRGDLVLTAYHTGPSPPPPIDVGISTWQRGTDLALPYRIKTSTNYQVARLAKIEGRERGYEEMILLNSQGRVAEALGCCLLMVRNGAVVTPPAWEGALESITVDLVEEICGTLGVPFARRPIDRTELLIADELALAGTLVEITLIRSVDGLAIPGSAITQMIQQHYLAAASGAANHAGFDISARPFIAMREAAAE
jgi:branched-chain amino acid aminotransferase